MLKNYFKTGLRNISKHKLFSLLNIVGLSIGMSVTLLILVVFENVIRFDDFQKNRDNIYRVYTEEVNEDGKIFWATTFPEIANQLEVNQSIKKITRINKSFSGTVTYQTKEIPLNGYFADSNFFSVFNYEFLSGNPNTALDNPFNIVLTDKAANKIFGDNDPFGETLNTKFGDFIISGIIKEPAGNSHLSFSTIGSYSTLTSLKNKGLIKTENWNWEIKNPEYIYLLIDNEKDIISVENQLNGIAKEIQALNDNISLSFHLQDIDDIVLGKHMAMTIGPSYPILDSMIFLSITLLILLPACFNYINLSIARSLNRGKEIGIRKILGSNKKQIVAQFITETFILALAASIGSLLIVYFMKDEFLMMLAPASRLNVIDISIISYLLAIILALFTALIAGIVPAIYFSKQKPLESLSSKVKPGSFGALNLRKALVVVQFALSIGFLIGISAFIKQYQHSLNLEMGFNKKNILVAPLADVNHNILRHEFQSQTEVKSVSFSSTIPGNWGSSKTVVRNFDSNDSLLVQEIFVDEHYLEDFGIKLIKGSSFNTDIPDQNGLVLVNQQFINAFGQFKPNEIDIDRIVIDSNKTARIIGVVENFNVTPMQKEIKPLLIRFNPDKYKYAFISLKSDNISECRERFATIWSNLSSAPFESKFLEHYLEEAYDTFEIAIKVLAWQGFFVIVISCLGLLGMVVFTTNNRIKEIGIRKVLGASEGKLIWLLSKSFLTLLIIATVIGVPISYLLFDFTLSRMQYQYVGIGFIEIFFSIFLLFLVGGVVIYWQTKKVASINPVDNLRNE